MKRYLVSNKMWSYIMPSPNDYIGEKACRINEKIVSHLLNFQQKVEINH